MLTLERKLLPGRVEISDRGVTRHDVFGDKHLAWDDVRAYHLAIEISPINDMFTQLVGVGDVLQVLDLARGMVGERDYKLGVVLDGDRAHIEIDGGFRDSCAGIAMILERLHPRFTDAARAQLKTGPATFGPLALSAESVAWKGEVSRDDVEKIDLFDDTPISLRVMTRDKALPHAKAPTAEIPNVLAALTIAKELGYRVRGLELLEALAVRHR